MQITNPAPTQADIWSWRTNVVSGVGIFNNKLSGARSYRTNILSLPAFRRMVNELNARRIGENLPPLTVAIPYLTSGNLNDNPEQLELDAVRGFNGWAGQDRFRLNLHEYRLKMDSSTGELALSVDNSNSIGTAIWEKVPRSARPNSGDPDYVAHVLGSNP
jgi:hypothetical protein